MSDLHRLMDVAIDVRPPDFDDLVVVRRRRTRRTRAVLAGGGAALAAAVVAGAFSLSSSADRTGPPPPSHDKKLDFVIPAGQQTITPEIRPDDVRGFDVLATVTNTQPGHHGETYLETTVTAHKDTEIVVYSCQAHDVPTWVAYADGDLVADSPGGAHDGWTFQKCSDEPFSLALHAELGESTFRLGLEQKTARMFAMAPPSAEMRACLDSDSPDNCLVLPDPIAETDAEFGFRIYEHAPARQVLQILDDADGGDYSGEYSFEAVSIINGAAWLVDRAVIAAPDADRLAVELPASDRDYLIDVYAASTDHVDRCMKQHADEIPDYESTDHSDYEAAVDRVCGVDLRLVVDGTNVPRHDVDPEVTGHFTELGARLSAGSVHQVAVEVVRGNPSNLQYALVVRTRTEMP